MPDRLGDSVKLESTFDRVFVQVPNYNKDTKRSSKKLHEESWSTS